MAKNYGEQPPQDQEPEDEKPIRGPYKEFARRLRALVGTSSLRAIAAKTQVNFSTIGSMLDGFRGSAESTDKVAVAYGQSRNEFRRLVGYPQVPVQRSLLELGQPYGTDLDLEAESEAFARIELRELMEITGIPDFDTPDTETEELVLYYHIAPPNVRRAVKEILRTVAYSVTQIERSRAIQKAPKGQEEVRD